MTFTPTEGRLLYRLMHGAAHPDELLLLLHDPLASRANLHAHISNLRRKGVAVHFSDSLYSLPLIEKSLEMSNNG